MRVDTQIAVCARRTSLFLCETIFCLALAIYISVTVSLVPILLILITMFVVIPRIAMLSVISLTPMFSWFQ